ncbi:MAG: hypothetical protein AAF922_04725 [Pseudomonadota bacterium]
MTLIQARPRFIRWILAGPVTLIVTLAITAGMTAWWPKGAAGLDQIGMPLILTPVIWLCVFDYAESEEHLGQAFFVLLAIILGKACFWHAGKSLPEHVSLLAAWCPPRKNTLSGASRHGALISIN